jgi:hypothetical protein
MQHDAGVFPDRIEQDGPPKFGGDLSDDSDGFRLEALEMRRNTACH